MIGVDYSAIIEQAREIVKTNGLDSVITLIRGKLEDISLPGPSVHRQSSNVTNAHARLLSAAYLGEICVKWGICVHARARILRPPPLVFGETPRTLHYLRRCRWH